MGLALGEQVMCHSFVSCFMQLTSNALVLQAKANIISHTMYRICNYNRDGVFFHLAGDV